jgi:hypothetical protein
MSDPFNSPATGGGDKLPLDDLVGALLIFDVREQCTEMQTSFGPASPIRCDVAVLDGGHKAETYPDTLVFPRVLMGQLRPHIGGKVLGRLGKGEAKPGKSAPWTLTDPTEADKETGRKYLAFVAAKTAEIETPF